MELTSSGSFFKFQHIGDSIEGLYVSFASGVSGKFGPEDQLILEANGVNTMVRCSKALSRTISDNLKKLPGKVLTITYVSDKPTNKGNPMKVFKVEANDPKPASNEDSDLDFPGALA